MSNTTYTIPQWQGLDEDPTITASNFVDVDGNPANVEDDTPTPAAQATTKVKGRIEILSAFDALQPQPPINWIVDGLISAGSVSMFFGEGGSKKTYALVDMAVCVSLGNNWLDFKTQKKHVLIIDEESGRRRIMGRLGDVLRGHNADQNAPVYCVSLAAFNLGLAADINMLHSLIKTSNSQLVIIDALADVMPGRDENAVKDTQPIFLALRRIAEDTQAAIIIIHHSNKGGGYRGSTAMKGAVDLLLEVTSKTGSDEITFKTEKARDTTATTFSAKAAFVQDMFWLSPLDSISQAPTTYKKGDKYVLRYLLAHGESGIKDISDNADTCAATTARNCVYALADAGLTIRTNGGGKGADATYNLTPAGLTIANTL